MYMCVYVRAFHVTQSDANGCSRPGMLVFHGCYRLTVADTQSQTYTNEHVQTSRIQSDVKPGEWISVSRIQFISLIGSGASCRS